MKDLKDYTDAELYAEQDRRSQCKRAENEARQSSCLHEPLSDLSISEEVDDCGGGGSVTFELYKYCKKCHKGMGTFYMTTYGFREGDEEGFLKGLEELCKKFGRFWSK